MLGRKIHFGKTMIAAVYESANGEAIVEILMRTYEGSHPQGVYRGSEKAEEID